MRPDDHPARPAGDDDLATGAGAPVAAHALLSAFEEAPIGMAVLTVYGVVTHHNAALAELLQRAGPDLVGHTLFELTHPEDLPAARRNCARMQTGLTRVLRHETRFLLPDGAAIWVSVSTFRPAAVPGHPPHLVMHVEDVSERRALEAELRRRALHDPLTGLPNRILLMDRIGHALARGARAPSSTCLFYVDLNGFKAVNDTHGHAAGDRLLQQFADRLTGLLRSGDTAARIGGDEFAVLCENTVAQQAVSVHERLRAAAAGPFEVAGGHSVTLSAAIGLSTATTPQDGAAPTDGEDLLARGALHMYQAKRHGPEGPVAIGPTA